MSEENGHLTIAQFLAANPVDPGVREVTLEDGSKVWFRRPSFGESRQLGIEQERGTPAQAVEAELRYIARLWCRDEKGTPALENAAQIRELSKRSPELINMLSAALVYEGDEGNG